MEALDNVIQEQNLEINPKAYDCLKSVLTDFDQKTFYTTKCFDNGYAARKVLEYSLSDKASADVAAINEAVAGGASRAEAVAPYLTDEAFDAWYTDFCAALDAAVQV